MHLPLSSRRLIGVEGTFQLLPTPGEVTKDFSGEGGISSKPRDYETIQHKRSVWPCECKCQVHFLHCKDWTPNNLTTHSSFSYNHVTYWQGDGWYLKQRGCLVPSSLLLIHVTLAARCLPELLQSGLYLSSALLQRCMELQQRSSTH